MERPDDRAEKAQADGAGEFGNSITCIEHSRFFVLAKLSEARRTGSTRERNEAKPGRKRCCANDMV